MLLHHTQSFEGSIEASCPSVHDNCPAVERGVNRAVAERAVNGAAKVGAALARGSVGRVCLDADERTLGGRQD